MQLINLINQSKIICTIANSVSNAALISSFLYLSLKRTPLIVLSTAISNTCIQPMFIQSSNDPRSRVIQQDVHHRCWCKRTSVFLLISFELKIMSLQHQLPNCHARCEHQKKNEFCSPVCVRFMYLYLCFVYFHVYSLCRCRPILLSVSIVIVI